MDNKELEKAALAYLDSIKNEFNSIRIEVRKEKISDFLAAMSKHIQKMGDTKNNIDDLMEVMFGHLKCKIVFEIGRTVLSVVSGLWVIQRRHNNGRPSTILKLIKSKNDEQKMIEKTKNIEKIYSKGYTEIKAMSVPTGDLVFINYFLDKEGEFAFNVADELKHEEEYSVNSKMGRQNCMTHLAEQHNLGYCQLGNMSAAVFKVSDDRIVIAPEYYYNDVTDSDEEPPADWDFLGNIDCSVWRIEFIDRQFLEANKNLDCAHINKKEHVVVKVSPGTWNVKNYYHSKSDKKLVEEFGYPTWIEINRN